MRLMALHILLILIFIMWYLISNVITFLAQVGFYWLLFFFISVLLYQSSMILCLSRWQIISESVSDSVSVSLSLEHISDWDSVNVWFQSEDGYIWDLILICGIVRWISAQSSCHRRSQLVVLVNFSFCFFLASLRGTSSLKWRGRTLVKFSVSVCFALSSWGDSETAVGQSPVR